ncbi:A/G-specific DNA-adenine glycosylase [Marinococcus luteus]|uniref:Adenine DNA glycosylase n=1 Tax=Marinococcus luteus TaxID=1122204 RepID=A0A1H2X9B3_9BACI|nr:A/G-specific adenine glycosylase [Marinococcus luteus]SDW89346.1 A/G-specific DNA-adenine glycosylase [Marinococcus luteus]
MNPLLEKFSPEQFQQDLVDWYRHQKRDLPWRRSADPYHIWISEIMLQQTKVDTVIPYYYRFLEAFPTIEALAEAEEDQVMKQWEGLGYYSRARNLHHAVKEVAEEYGGEVPDGKKEFRSLKGVGPYTAGAVLSIAFDKPEPAVDGNVMRVFSRLLCLYEDIGKQSTKSTFEAVLGEILPLTSPSDFNQAVMELGALICTPTSPGCLLCPVQEHCKARAAGVQEELPVKEKKKAPRKQEMAAAIIWNDDGEVLIHQRPDKGLLARLWEFPNTAVENEAERAGEMGAYLEADAHIKPKIDRPVQRVEQTFSHLIWNVHVYEGKAEKSDLPEGWRWVPLKEVVNYALPVAHQKIYKTLVEGMELK